MYTSKSLSGIRARTDNNRRQGPMLEKIGGAGNRFSSNDVHVAQVWRRVQARAKIVKIVKIKPPTSRSKSTLPALVHHPTPSSVSSPQQNSAEFCRRPYLWTFLFLEKHALPHDVTKLVGLVACERGPQFLRSFKGLEP